MPKPPTPPDVLWATIHSERSALAVDLADLDEGRWAQPSLCGRWSIEEVVARLTAAASVGRIRWVASIVGARFDTDVHNARRLAEHRGATTQETLERFRRVVCSTTAATGHLAAWLGEVVVHAQDVRRPLGLTRTPPVQAVTEVARFYASRDFAVASRSAAEGLRLEAIDVPFAAGAGLVVSGNTLALTMATAGRRAYAEELTGPGAPVLLERCP